MTTTATPDYLKDMMFLRQLIANGATLEHIDGMIAHYVDTWDRDPAEELRQAEEERIADAERAARANWTCAGEGSINWPGYYNED